jgi:hypothetical protein
MKIRFLKVKEELRMMREERTKKENAYRLMQRESKQCDIIQKELLKLKESKVSFPPSLFFSAFSLQYVFTVCIYVCMYVFMYSMYRMYVITTPTYSS